MTSGLVLETEKISVEHLVLVRSKDSAEGSRKAQRGEKQSLAYVAVPPTKHNDDKDGEGYPTVQERHNVP